MSGQQELNSSQQQLEHEQSLKETRLYYEGLLSLSWLPPDVVATIVQSSDQKFVGYPDALNARLWMLIKAQAASEQSLCEQVGGELISELNNELNEYHQEHNFIIDD